MNPTVFGPARLRQLRNPQIGNASARVLRAVHRIVDRWSLMDGPIDLVRAVDLASMEADTLPGTTPHTVVRVLVGWVVLQELGDECPADYAQACRLISWRRGADGCRAVVERAVEIAEAPDRII